MKTFILLTKLAAPDARVVEIGAKHDVRARSGRSWLKEIAEKCPSVQFKAHYALMGYWDSMHIYEAPDEDTAAVISMMTRAHGAAQVETWVALPYERILKLSEELQCPRPEKEK